MSLETSEQYYKRVISGHEGTHLAHSRRSPDAFASGELDDETNQVVDSSEWMEVHPPTDESESHSGGFLWVTVGAAVGAAGMYLAMKHALPWWKDRGQPALERLRRRPSHLNEKNSDVAASQDSEDREGQVVLLTPDEFSSVVTNVLENLVQKRLSGSY